MIAPPKITKRTYSSRQFALELDGGIPGFLKSVEGGNLKSTVVMDPAGPDNVIHKHIAQPEFDEISFQLGLVASPTINTWIRDSWQKKVSRKHGAVIGCDFNYKEVWKRTFREALITEIGFPACDASAKDAGYLTVKIKPEIVEYKEGDGHTVRATFPDTQKHWSPANFRLAVDELDCSQVSKIDAFTIKQGTTRFEYGEHRDATVEPTKLEYPNLSVYIAESHAKTWIKWAEEFIHKGKNDKEKQGAITFLSPNLKETLGTVTLKNIGIFSMGYEKSESGAEGVKKVKCELYVEEMVYTPVTRFTVKII